MSGDFKSFKQLGEAVAQLGWHTPDDVDALAAKHREEWPLFLASAVFGRLGEAINELRAIKYVALAMETRDREGRRAPAVSSHPVADGLLAVLAGGKSGLVGDNDFSGLSVRARKTLSKLADVPMADLAEDMLVSRRNCGITTAREILAWRDGGGVA